MGDAHPTVSEDLPNLIQDEILTLPDDSENGYSGSYADPDSVYSLKSSRGSSKSAAIQIWPLALPRWRRLGWDDT